MGDTERLVVADEFTHVLYNLKSMPIRNYNLSMFGFMTIQTGKITHKCKTYYLFLLLYDFATPI